MTAQLISLPIQGQLAGFRRFSVDEYHRLIGDGYLTEDDNLELLEGYLVLKMSRNPPHDVAIQLLQESLTPRLPRGWSLRIQSAISLPDSEPEPDVGVVRGVPRDYLKRHPGPKDIGMLVEVSDSTLAGDRIDKARIFSRASVPIYWIINLIDRVVEVYTSPSGPTPAPAYMQRAVYRTGESVPVVLDGVEVGTIRVDDILP